MRFRFLYLCAGLMGLFQQGLAQGATELKLEHVANAGVRIVSDKSVILIDSLFNTNKHYTYLSDDAFKLLLNKPADVALVTHAHGDHFTADRTVAFLQNHPQTAFISTPPVIKELKGKVKDNQLFTQQLNGFEGKTFEHNNITITALSIPHAVSPKTPNDIRIKFRKEFPNYGYLVEVNGWKILHIGDGDFSQAIIDGLKLAELDIDVALLPSWVPEEEGGIALIKNLNADNVVFMHLTVAETQSYNKMLKEKLPNAQMLVTGYESVTVSK